MARLAGFNAADVQAIIEDEAGGGRPSDPAAPRNAPAFDPWTYRDKVVWHADWFQYERLIDEIVTVNHTSLAGGTVSVGNAHQSIVVGVNIRVTDIPLWEHDLGYVPVCFVQYDGSMIIAGTEVQRDATGRYRLVTMYATDSVVGIREIAVADSSALTSSSRDYRVGICRNPTPDPGLPLFGTVDGHIVLGRGKVNTANKYARELGAGEDGFKVDLERTIDINSGRRRTVVGGVTTTESGYAGSFTGGAYVEIGFGDV